MFQSLVQKLNISRTSNKSNSPEHKNLAIEPCQSCKGAGCCYLCDHDDDWGIMVFCSNKKENHVVHQACDNLTPELFRCICLYYCPKCRHDYNLKVTFYKRVSENKRNEIRNLLKSFNQPVNSPKNFFDQNGLSLKKVDTLGKSNQNLERSNLNLEPGNQPKVKDTINDLMESLLQQVEKIHNPEFDKKSLTDSESDSTIEGSSDDDSFRLNFPGQLTKKSVSESDMLKGESFVGDSFTIHFPGQLSRKSASENNLSNVLNSQNSFNSIKSPKGIDTHDLLNVSFNSKKSSEALDNSCASNEPIIKSGEKNDKTKLINLINILTEKLQREHEEKTNLANIIKGQEKEIMALQRDILKIELEYDEAAAVAKTTMEELDNLKNEHNTLKSKFQEFNCLKIDPNEAFSHDPFTVFEMYKQESILSNKKSVQIKCLLNDNQSYRQNLLELKQENEDLRDKVQKLKEDDIDKKILNFTIEENRRLELKIKIQRDRNVNMGLEYRNQLDKTYDLEIENKHLRKKVISLEKKSKNDSLVMAESKENDWETISISTEPEVNIAPVSPKTSSPNSNGSIEFLVKKALKEILDNDKKSPKNSTENYKKPDGDNISKQRSNMQSSGAKTGQNHSNGKTVCKFYLQNRCIFGYKCRNLHPVPPKQNYIPPWNPNVFPNGVPQNQPSFSPRVPHNINNSYSVTGFKNEANRGKSVGYWSFPPIPIASTRFSQLSEVNLNGKNSY